MRIAREKLRAQKQAVEDCLCDVGFSSALSEGKVKVTVNGLGLTTIRLSATLNKDTQMETADLVPSTSTS